MHPTSSSPPPFSRSVSDSDSILQHSFSKNLSLPDPAQFPDPYPFRHPHAHTPPALSSAGSSSTSTRSSAYTSSGASAGDFAHVHVASPDDDANIGIGITSDDVVQLLASHTNASLSSSGSQSRTPIDHSRWSESYSASSRSRSSSVVQSISGHDAPGLRNQASYDTSWQPVDERDEVGISEDDTDDEPSLDHSFGFHDALEDIEERTSAAVMAEEGRGLIVRGDNTSIVQLQVLPGTTHLLVGSSTTPNAMPSFLTNTIPTISSTLLALDISANFLVALPPCLATCFQLEELNIASNPLRVLPVFLSHLTSLRVLIADATGICTLPDALSELDKLHTISVRRNKMNALPSWLCLLPSLQTLFVDGNPFQGPWKSLVEPLLPKPPVPSLSVPPASANSPATTEEDMTDNGNASDPANGDLNTGFLQSPDEEVTITPDRAAWGRSGTEPVDFGDSPSPPSRQVLSRTRTLPTRAPRTQAKQGNHIPKSVSSARLPPVEDSGYFGDLEVRKMKSAGDLRKRFNPEASSNSTTRTLSRPTSSATALDISYDRPPMGKRYASFGAASGLAAISGTSTKASKRTMSASLWDNISDNEADVSVSPSPSRFSFTPKHSHKPSTKESRQETVQRVQKTIPSRQEKGSKWGFLKKMSMGKMRVDSPTSSIRSPSQGRLTISKPIMSSSTAISPSEAAPEELRRSTPQLDVRFSTSGILDSVSSQMEHPPTDGPKGPSASSSATNLLTPPPSVTPRAGKRRSFLPIDSPMSIPIPEPSGFVSGLVVSNGTDDTELTKSPSPPPSPAVDPVEQRRREDEKIQESYMRALRSVMAYLRDMHDLGSSQTSPPVSTYSSTEQSTSSRSRRPTLGESSRAPSEVSVALSGTTAVSNTSGHLRSVDSIAGMRSGSATQTLSVHTTASTGSEERKFKDDKSKRAMVIREIVETERTYVKGLQELVDIYIKPGATPVNLLSGASSKETVVPASERKIVFSGIEALFSFHKESFLPALEAAAAPLVKKANDAQDSDADGQLSLRVAKALGSMFLKHAAFMKMYSTYINNFDNSVRRVRVWTSDRHSPGTTSPGSAISPSSSTPQLVGLGLTLAALAPSATAEPVSSNSALTLSASQRKRIRAYLKRCRMNTRHSQLNLEGYLLLPVQRIPRYRLLLGELLSVTPPTSEFVEDPLDKALTEISTLANNMNEGKRESESRRKLVQWQTRIRGKFPSPLVQPHRRLIMDGPLLLTRVVRKAMVAFETFNAQGDSSTVQVDCLAPELTPRRLIGILCNDLLVLCRDPSDGQDPTSHVDLWAVLRMQTLPQPASIVHGNSLRLVDNKAILYFDCPSASDALNWFRAINLHIPASKI